MLDSRTILKRYTWNQELMFSSWLSMTDCINGKSLKLLRLLTNQFKSILKLIIYEAFLRLLDLMYLTVLHYTEQITPNIHLALDTLKLKSYNTQPP